MKKIEFMLEKSELEEMFQQDRETYEEVQSGTVSINGQQYIQETVFDILGESGGGQEEPDEPEKLECPRDIPWSPHDDSVSIELNSNSNN